MSLNWSHLILCIVLMTFAEMISIPATTAATGSLAPPDRVGRYMGLYGLVQGIGWSMGPFMGSQLFDVYAGRPVTLWAMLSFSALMAGIGFFWIGFNKYSIVNSRPCKVEKNLPQRLQDTKRSL
jgi:MFS family permease